MPNICRTRTLFFATLLSFFLTFLPALSYAQQSALSWVPLLGAWESDTGSPYIKVESFDNITDGTSFIGTNLQLNGATIFQDVGYNPGNVMENGHIQGQPFTSTQAFYLDSNNGFNGTNLAFFAIQPPEQPLQSDPGLIINFDTPVKAFAMNIIGFEDDLKVSYNDGTEEIVNIPILPQNWAFMGYTSTKPINSIEFLRDGDIGGIDNLRHSPYIVSQEVFESTNFVMNRFATIYENPSSLADPYFWTVRLVETPDVRMLAVHTGADNSSGDVEAILRKVGWTIRGDEQSAKDFIEFEADMLTLGSNGFMTIGLKQGSNIFIPADANERINSAYAPPLVNRTVGPIKFEDFTCVNNPGQTLQFGPGTQIIKIGMYFNQTNIPPWESSTFTMDHSRFTVSTVAQ